MKIIDPEAELLMLDKNIKATITKLLREKTVEHVTLSCKSLLSETAIKLLNKQLNSVDLTDAQTSKLKTLLRQNIDAETIAKLVVASKTKVVAKIEQIKNIKREPVASAIKLPALEGTEQ